MHTKAMVKKDWTSLLVQKSTRDIVNKIGNERKRTQDGVVMDFINMYSNSGKQIIIVMDDGFAAEFQNATKFLYETKCIGSLDLNVCARFALNNLVEGVKKSLQGRV
jgi:DUF1009 family protein